MTPRLLLAVSERRVIVLLPEPRECACGRAVRIVINRRGQSRCVACDAEEQLEGGEA